MHLAEYAELSVDGLASNWARTAVSHCKYRRRVDEKLLMLPPTPSIVPTPSRQPGNEFSHALQTDHTSSTTSSGTFVSYIARFVFLAFLNVVPSRGARSGSRDR